MKSYCVLFLTLFSLTLLQGQIFDQNNWIMVSSNNYRVFQFNEDALKIYTTKDFNLKTTESVKIYFYINAKSSSSNDSIQILSTDDFVMEMHKLFPNSMLLQIRDLSNADTSRKIMLVSEEETERYSLLKDFKTMSDEEIFNFLDFLPAVNDGIDVDRHVIYSRMKYKLVEMGFNPKFQLNKLFEMITNSKNKDILNKLSLMK